MYTALREFWVAGQRFLAGDEIPDDVSVLMNVEQAKTVGNITDGVPTADVPEEPPVEAQPEVATEPLPEPEAQPEPQPEAEHEA